MVEGSSAMIVGGANEAKLAGIASSINSESYGVNASPSRRANEPNLGTAAEQRSRGWLGWKRSDTPGEPTRHPRHLRPELAAPATRPISATGQARHHGARTNPA